MSSIALKDAKLQLRKSIKSQLQHISQESLRTQSVEVLKRLREHQPFVDAKRIALYMNMPHLEIQTNSIIQTCFEMGKRVYLPRCNTIAKEGRKKNHLSMLEMKSYDDVLRLKPQGKYQLLEPTEGPDIMEEEGGKLDVIIVPGVAFTSEKQRIGHGAGFYDEFLATYYTNKHTSPHLIGIGLREQLVGIIPKEKHDWDLNTLIIADTVY
ncbi:nagb/rpia/CoA transferase-like protein [Suhomyces tanzawaensis NRRL Y-17324]|uniref:5-formyltetrahydrofolate cyclo-ligase n=1 Tax=Suhomyces tanzawaensis NRRL Y-17324 TaxID=984487 RepID=A0A1E4SRY6_9ASCO|nr:nagb/rpia/CoA transferase-like protein [Suhomyces tanzawaensis NRRL Y-17324]ODV82268.1 nagb/rpia/CoA transferase-like protein [Suhomyces tanzawaensis NRRL Y-17324]